jgi:hypothetical protein
MTLNKKHRRKGIVYICSNLGGLNLVDILFGIDLKTFLYFKIGCYNFKTFFLNWPRFKGSADCQKNSMLKKIFQYWNSSLERKNGTVT